MKKLLVFAAALIVCAGVSVSNAQDKKKTDEKAATEITATLNKTAEGWNTADLPKYLAYYVPEATEMTSQGPKGGVEHIEQTMKNGFWKTGKPQQTLRFENVVVRMLGKDHALVTGQFILFGNDKPDRTGWFTTVWTKTKQGWRMIHDHS